MFIVIGELLTETAAPPDVRAALFEISASMPGILLMGEITDHADRRGIVSP